MIFETRCEFEVMAFANPIQETNNTELFVAL